MAKRKILYDAFILILFLTSCIKNRNDNEIVISEFTFITPFLLLLIARLFAFLATFS